MSWQRIYSILILFILTIGISSFIYYLQPNGIGESHDSVAYLRGARGILNGEGYVTETWGDPIPNSHYPPGFSALVAGIAYVLSIDVSTSAKLLNSFLFGLNISLVLTLLYLELQQIILAILGAFTFFWAHDIFYVHFWAWSEPLFLTCSLGIILTWRYFFQKNQLLWVGIAGIITGLGILVRYAGITWIPLGLLILLLNPSEWKTKAKQSLIFLIPSVLPYYLWGLRNKSLGQAGLGREFSIEWITQERWIEGCKTLTQWFFHDFHWLYFMFVLSIVLVITGYAVWLYWKEKKILLLSLMAYFWGTYLFLILSISFFDHGTPLDSRILVSHELVLLLACFIAIAPFFIIYIYIQYGFPILILIWAFYFYGKTIWFIQKGIRDGHGLISWELRFRDDVHKITCLPVNALIYSNEFENVWVGRAADRKVYPIGNVIWLGKKDSVIYVSYFANPNYHPTFSFPIEQIDTLDSGRLYKIKRKIL